MSPPVGVTAVVSRCGAMAATVRSETAATAKAEERGLQPDGRAGFPSSAGAFSMWMIIWERTSCYSSARP